MPPPIFRIPLELRLDIYSFCTAFTLLNLTRTSRLFRTEIFQFPSIYRSSFGFATNPETPDQQLSINTVKRVRYREECDMINAVTPRRWKNIYKQQTGPVRSLSEQWYCCALSFKVRRASTSYMGP
ncbi:hypothetical protein BJ508DRAFT_325529 [Ascobolus immersus RN42]|uniref:F-box domain-containing protein n=1 Tax=Ascobolus immersus RN42 TaxID=1160509 RepID=A0A3N4ICX0_ASCIM|nr:hypothetical protein BJ508DRAFT_325529 [Ascobolus immersus RN42]